MFKPRFVVIAGMIFAAAAVRLLPHPWNFTPVGAMALFGGATFFDRRTAFVVPFAALIISDLVLGFYPTWMFVYGSFALIVLFGRQIQNQKSISKLTAASLLSSVSFFLITNFGDWAFGSMYPQTSAGLIQCYTAAIPFFRNTLLGDLFFTAVLFGGFLLAERKFPALQQPAFAH